MSQNELRSAVGSIVELLNRTRVQGAVTEFRTALIQSDVSQAGSQLLNASNKLIDGLHSFNAIEMKAWRYLHLEQLGLPQYWNDIVSLNAGHEKTRAEIVQLYSRIMFASNHLPGLLSLLNSHSSDEEASSAAQGNDFLNIKLYDAGEKASDPDRISRTLDGVDMLYSACVNLAKKPAVELSLQKISGLADRHIQFEGDYDAIGAVKTIIDSIADGIAGIEDVNNFDPDKIVSYLPVFEDLKTLQKMGTFKEDETAEIVESIHEGCLLIMESGVMLEQPVQSSVESTRSTDSVAVNKTVDIAKIPTIVKSGPKIVPTDISQKITVRRINAGVPRPLEQGDAAAVNDSSKKPEGISANEHYQAYLKEKNRKLAKPKKQDVSVPMPSKDVTSKQEQGLKEDALGELILDLNKITHK